MPCFLYVLAAYDPDDNRAYPAYACSELSLDPDDARDRDTILRLMAQGHGLPADDDYAELVRDAYARLRDEGVELDRHTLAVPLPYIPPDHLRTALWDSPGTEGLPGDLPHDQGRGQNSTARADRAAG